MTITLIVSERQSSPVPPSSSPFGPNVYVFTLYSTVASLLPVLVSGMVPFNIESALILDCALVMTPPTVPIVTAALIK